MRAIGCARRYAIDPVDGYSIEEAAEVLGVPKRRVRELVARGVILGTQEDDGELRVYLQPRPPAALRAETDSDPGFEASPFRELLTEFRSLTERYGQALLALGESRGEVAALRGRIEALETRVDLRLGTSAQPSVVEWHAPPPSFGAETLADVSPAETSDDASATTEASMPLTGAEAADEVVVASAEALLAEAEASDDAAPGSDEHAARLSDEPTIAEIEAELAQAVAASEAQGITEETEPVELAAETEESLSLEAEAEPAAGDDGDAPTTGVEAPVVVEDQGEEPATEVEAVAAEVAESEEAPAAQEAGEAEEAAEAQEAGEAEEPEAVEAEAEPARDAEPEDAEAERARRPRRAGFAAGGIAEALARAMDPSAAELPAPPDLGAIDQAEPRDEIAPTEEAAPIDETRYSTAIEEPDWLDESELTWLDAADREPAETAEDQRMADQSDAAAEQPDAGDTGADQAEAAHEIASTTAIEEDAEQPEVSGEEPDEAWAESEPEPSVDAEPEIAYAESTHESEAESVPAGSEPEAVGEADAPTDAGVEAAYSPPAWDDWEFASTAYAATSDDLPVGEEAEPQSESAEEDVVGPTTESQVEIAAVQVVEPNPDAAEPVAGALPDESIDLGMPATAPSDDTGEVALMWLGSEFDDRDDYADEIEVGTAGWHRPGGRDELTRIAADQGWDPTEVEAIRNLLEPASDGPVDMTDATAQAEDSQTSEPERTQPEPFEPEPQPAPEPEATATEQATDGKDAEPQWPAADRTVSFSLPGGDDLQRALEALGLPSRASAERQQQTPTATAQPSPQPRQWSKVASAPQGSGEPEQPPADASTTNPTGDVPRAWPSAGTVDSTAQGPTGEPEWLRGRRDPAARAFRRLRRIFPG
jgi:excisionase family DNA binding protein